MYSNQRKVILKKKKSQKECWKKMFFALFGKCLESRKNIFLSLSKGKPVWM